VNPLFSREEVTKYTGEWGHSGLWSGEEETDIFRKLKLTLNWFLKVLREGFPIRANYQLFYFNWSGVCGQEWVIAAVGQSRNYVKRDGLSASHKRALGKVMSMM
jgi:hypothetical protein